MRASPGQGSGTTYTTAYDLSSCMAAGKHTQANDRVRIVNGELDMFVGGSEAVARSQSEIVTGLKCTTSSKSCFRSNGSGWYVVKNSEVVDLYADHCFMGYGGVDAVSQCSGIYVDSNYQNGSGAWGVKASVDWMKTFVTP